MFTSKNAMMSILSVLVVLSLGFGVLTAQAEEMKQGKVIGKKQAKDDGMGMIAIPGKNYEMSKYEVTQGQWQAIMGSNPSYFKSCGENCPVDQVSWNDIQEFLQKLNAKTGKQYRLPSEAEWEYACYGGSQTEYCGGNDLNSVAWNRDNSNKTTHPVGQKQANGFGLYDMSGNAIFATLGILLIVGIAYIYFRMLR